MPFSQRTHDLRMISNKCGTNALGFNVLTNEFVNKTRGGAGVRAFNIQFLTKIIEELSSFFSGKILTRGKLYLESFLESLHHGNSSPWRGKIDIVILFWIIRVGMIVNNIRTSEFLDHTGEHVFGHIHQIMIVSVSPIELARGEFRVMSHINTFVSELFTNFENSIHTTNNKHFQVQLGSNSHEEFHVQIVMESLKGASSSTTSDHIHHGGFDLNEIKFGQIVSNVGNNFVSSLENLLDRVIHDKIKVSLTISSILGQNHASFCLLGDLMEAVRKRFNIGWSNGKLTILGKTWITLNTNNITSSKVGMKSLKLTLVLILSSHNLNLVAITFNINENKLCTCSSNRVNSTSDSNLSVVIKNTLLSAFAFVFLSELINSVCTLEFVRVRVISSLSFSFDSVLAVFSVFCRI
mmetsp:Transcript_37852/g.51406  ORF Transcript_37852/g.51406 Transcript_37852/m.51406 type:complete len:409 (-) Transcript_37852:225-1451(-)